VKKWVCHKLESFSEFLNSYAVATRKADFCYLELFAGYRSYSCNRTECTLEGTASRALRSPARFGHYAFLAANRSAATDLNQAVQPFVQAKDIRILAGNCNKERTLMQLLDSVPRSASSLAFIDPGGYRKIKFTTLQALSVRGKNWKGAKPDLLIVFPLEMALVKNMMRPECEPSITGFYGNREWESLKRLKLGRKIRDEDIKSQLVEIFKNGLRNLGYRYVDDLKPASPAAETYYHLIYASDTGSQARSLNEAWGKPRYLRCELLYGANSKRRNQNRSDIVLRRNEN
jgi:three-Cys-motif partner protein